MTLHVHDDGDGINVWCDDVPVDCTDVDVRRTIEECAADGDKVAARAVALMHEIRAGSWCRMNGSRALDGMRCYLDEPPRSP